MSNYIEKIVNSKIKNMETLSTKYEVGHVKKVREYILEVTGMESVGYYERVTVADHSVGYVTGIEKNYVIVAILQQNGPIYVGDEVISTGRSFAAMYSNQCIGHMINIFGEDILLNEKFDGLQPIPVETDPIPIMERGTVNRPFYTGIAGIDLIYPIGFGQRQLIIGDKKTGKTQIALDAIVNQSGKDVLCIYVAINKPKKLVKEIYNELMLKGAMKYTLIMATFLDDAAPVSYFTPYAALSIAEAYMRKGIDVCVVIDDLKAHADCHREISLLAGKVPGRDAYPPDIFYTHSRMLEKGCQHKSGGSITILPIVETKGGTITDYISTNVISITDGQLVLSKKNFEAGYKPAINYGLSVSRLGGAVQDKDMKKLGAKVRQEFLSYLESKEVYSLANMEEMSAEMQARFQAGKKLEDRLMQYKYSPRSKDEIMEMFKDAIEV